MSTELSSGTVLKTISGKSLSIKKLIGSGGQGSVYIVDYCGRDMALKWYNPAALGDHPEKFRNNLISNMRKGAPSKEFLWPLDVTEDTNDSFGYVMELRPDDYYEMSCFMVKKVEFSSYKTVVDAALQIVSAYRKLHNAGYSYQDLNDGNFFFNPSNGKVLICDNDNVAPDGEETGIIGKPRYMAPEIVMKKNLPNTLSDLFSMSVILFILFCMSHPLEGKRSLEPCLTPSLQEKLYGSEPLFVLDPNDNSNGPDDFIHKNVKMVWGYLPSYIQELFLKAFSQTALHNPNARPKEIDWINGLVRFRSEIVQCSCGNEVFTHNGQPCKCEVCKKQVVIPYRLDFDMYSVPGIKDSRIYRCQLGVCKAEDALKPMGRVLEKSDTPGMLGLRNLSESAWRAITPSGKAKVVEPQEIIPLKDGIQFTVENKTIKIFENK